MVSKVESVFFRDELADEMVTFWCFRETYINGLLDYWILCAFFGRPYG